MRVSSLWVGAAMALAGYSAAQGATPSGPVVRVAQGAAQGALVKGVEAYLNLPYAQAPEGALRWREPVAAKPWHGTRDASRFGPACYQASGGAGWGPYTAEFIAPEPFSEDCLTANVWRPAGAVGKLPVLVFIHGGGFGGGGATVPLYDGAALARRGAVVVTIQYRVGVFGFLAHPDLTAQSPLHSSGNYGLLDQIEALKWVKANIARFGGNPANVTVSGESAGAASVAHLLVSPLAKGLFAKAIAFSGASMGVDVPSMAEGYGVAAQLGQRLGGGGPADWRKAAAADLVAATRAVPEAGAAPPPLVYVPHRDGVVVRHDPSDGGAPVASKVPVMTGYNGAEMIAPDVDTPAKFEAAVRRRYGGFADRLLALYPHVSEADARRSNLLLARDRYMTGALVWAQKRKAASGQEVRVFLYDHDYPAAPGGMGWGAFHSSQLPYVFGNLGQGGRRFTAADAGISRQWQDVILTFMRKGGSTAWPVVTAATGTRAMRLGDTTGYGPVVSSPERFAAFRDYGAAGGNLGLM